jgi:hypothetical protein
MRCDECRFWVRNENIEREGGDCRLKAPRMLGEVFIGDKSVGCEAESLVASWPNTKPSDWCGEFQPKPEENP